MYVILLFILSNGFSMPSLLKSFFFFFSAGFVVRLVLLGPGGGSRGKLFQLPELWRVRVVQRPLLRLDRAAVPGRQDGST